MSDVRRQDAKLYVNAAAKESTYGTPNDPDTSVQLLMGNGFQHFKEVSVKAPNTGMTTGTEGPNAQLTTLRYYMGTLTWDWVYPNDLAFVLAYLLGGCTSAQNAATGQYEHDFADVASTHTLPSFTLVDHHNADLYKQYAGCIISRMSFTAGVQGSSMTADVIAKSVADVDASDALLTDEPCIIASNAIATTQEMNMYVGAAAEGSFDADVDTADVTSSTNYQAKTRSFSITIDNGIDINNMITWAGVNTLTRPERGIRTVSAQMTLEEDSAYTLQVYVAANTLHAVEWEWDSKVVAGTAGNNYAAQFVIPDASFNDASHSGYSPNGKTLYTYDLSALDADSTNHRVNATVWNEVAAYAA